MAVPVVRTIVQDAGEDAMKFIGIDKQQAAYIAPIALTIQGRLTTRYLKGIRYREKNWTITPLVEYHVRRDEFRAELNYYYGF